jgi:hypothetical protein
MDANEEGAMPDLSSTATVHADDLARFPQRCVQAAGAE